VKLHLKGQRRAEHIEKQHFQKKWLQLFVAYILLLGAVGRRGTHTEQV
jgi:hypothetical protein